MSKKIVKEVPKIEVILLSHLSDNSVIGFKFHGNVYMVESHPLQYGNYVISTLKASAGVGNAHYSNASFKSVTEAAEDILSHASNHELRLFDSVAELAEHFGI